LIDCCYCVTWSGRCSGEPIAEVGEPAAMGWGGGVVSVAGTIELDATEDLQLLPPLMPSTLCRQCPPGLQTGLPDPRWWCSTPGLAGAESTAKRP